MSVDLTAGVVRILYPNGETAGTGFVASKDGLILTCAHVVKLAGGQRGGTVRVVYFRTGFEATATVDAEQWLDADTGDVAVLHVSEALASAVPLPLGSSDGTTGHPFKAFGFPAQDPVKGMFGYGTIGDRKPEVEGFDILQVTASTEVTEGFSGGPILDVRNRRIVGMVSDVTTVDRSGRGGQTSFIIPTETLRVVCPKLQTSNICPYLGLDAFSEEDVDFFFGRERDIDRLLNRLTRSPGFVAVLGPSGSGKSSVVQAGLLPRLRTGVKPGSEQWGIVVTRPANDPFAQLALAGIVDKGNNLIQAVNQWLTTSAGKSRLLLIIDQFEELFVSCEMTVRRQFVEQLIALLQSSLPLTVIIVMRDDFYSRVTELAPELVPWIEDGLANIRTTLETDDLTNIVQGPANVVGLEVEPSLLMLIQDQILEMDSGASVGERLRRSSVLPLLEFALTLVWAKREENVLTASAYTSLGGLSGGLTQWADDTYRRFADPDQRIVEQIFKKLIYLGNESERTPDTRIRRSVQSLYPSNETTDNVRRVLWMLADARLLVTYRDEQTKQESVEIIHDALIREWGRLRQWVTDDKRFLLWRQFIENRSQAWWESNPDEGSARNPDRLLRGRDLIEAEDRLKERQADVGPDEQQFIQASIDFRDQERIREEAEQVQRESERSRNRKRIVGGSLVFACVALALAGIAVSQWKNSEQRRKIAQNQTRLALIESAQTLLQKADSLSKDHRPHAAGAVLLRALEIVSSTEQDADITRIRHRIWQHFRYLDLRPTEFLEGHAEPVQDIDISPDGKIAVTSSGYWGSGLGAVRSVDDTVRLWDLGTNQQLAVLGEHKAAILRVRFAPQSKSIASASQDGEIKIWDPASRALRCQTAVGQFDSNLATVDFSRDGKWIFSERDSAWNQNVGLMNWWSTIDCKKMGFPSGSVPKSDALFWDDNAHNRMWTAMIPSGKIIAQWRPEKAYSDGTSWFEVWSAALSPDGVLAAVGPGDSHGVLPDCSVILWSATTGQVVRRLEARPKSRFC